MSRDQVLIALRSQIHYEAIQTNPNQLFQDKTLRPILKFQHTLIIAIYHDYLKTHKIAYTHATAAQRNLKIENSIKQNQALQALFKGVIIALFTTDETAFWATNKEEINKRIQQLIIKRIQSSFETVKDINIEETNV